VLLNEGTLYIFPVEDEETFESGLDFLYHCTHSVDHVHVDP